MSPADLTADRPASAFLLTPEQAASLLGTTERHLRYLRSAHGLKAVRLGGKVRYRVSDLDDFVERCTTT